MVYGGGPYHWNIPHIVGSRAAIMMSQGPKFKAAHIILMLAILSISIFMDMMLLVLLAIYQIKSKLLLAQLMVL